MSKTRDKRMHIFDPLIRRKAQHLEYLNSKKQSVQNEKLNNTCTNSTQEGSIKNRDIILHHDQAKPNYDDYSQRYSTKKGRIQSAHPIMSQKRPGGFNGNPTLYSSFALNRRKTGTRPMSSSQSNMKEYLNKVISIIEKRKYNN